MASPSDRLARQILDKVLANRDVATVTTQLSPRLPASEPLPPSIPAKDEYSRDAMLLRREFLKGRGFDVRQLSGEGEEIDPAKLAGNIESLIGRDL